MRCARRWRSRPSTRTGRRSNSAASVRRSAPAAISTSSAARATSGEAHLIRTLRSPARLLYGLRDRATARLHGACVGAGIEVPAAAGRVVARPDAFFRLPEVAMGLIPGAGGVATIPRRIGRQRACWMAISGVDVDAATALAWGLVDAVEP